MIWLLKLTDMNFKIIVTHVLKNKGMGQVDNSTVN